jgi:UDP-2,3-diacylglucosamine hydrolase
MFSDLHLREPNEELYQAFLRSLAKIESASHVVFAGDIFDVFSGENSYFIEKHSRFFDAVSSLRLRGCSSYFIEGNHDMHLSPTVEKRCGAKVLSTELEITLASKRFYIAHGDLVDTDDHAYLRLRKLMRSRPAKAFFKFLPGFLAQGVGIKMSQKSQTIRKQSPSKYNSEELRKKYHNFADQKFSQGFDFVLMGHCHDFDEYRPLGLQKQYLNSGFPPTHRTYMRWQEGDLFVSREAF